MKPSKQHTWNQSQTRTLKKGEGGLGQRRDPKVSVVGPATEEGGEMVWTDVKSDKRQAWQAPAWLSVTTQGPGSGRCQDNADASLWRSVPPEVVQNGCRHANALLRVTGSAVFVFLFFSHRKCHLWVTAGPQPFILNAVNKAAIFAFWGSSCLHITTGKAVCCHERY